jgi:hypothetical protein
VANYIETGNKIIEIFNLVEEVVEAEKTEREDVRDANAFLVLLRRMAAKETAEFDLKEFKGRVLPHANLNWNVRYADPNSPSFFIEFKPDPDLMRWCGQKTPGKPWPGELNCTLEPKQLGVNMGLVKQLPNLGIMSLFGKDANEIEGAARAKAVVEWMQKQEDGLTMAYGLRERARIGR